MWKDRIDYIVIAILLILIALGGGSAFADTLSLLYVRPAAVVAIVIFCLTPARIDWRAIAVPLIMFVILAVIVAVQLVPLPPVIWTALPGRTPYLEATSLLGMAELWRPISLTPDLTLNSLVSLVVPAAVLLGFAKITPVQRRKLVVAFIILCCVSIVIGIAQFAGGDRSVLYSYKRTYNGMPVGLLANRNHQAAMLAAVFPALRAWTLSPAPNMHWAQRRIWVAVAIAVITVPVILATGSRAGILLGLGSLAASFALFPSQSSRKGKNVFVGNRFLRIGMPVILIAMVLATWRFGRALSIQRLAGGGPAVEEDLRFRFAPYVWRIVEKNFPIGTGFGSFDPLFRQYEPDAALKNTFFNHAHNELLELLMTAGLVGAALLIAFLAWWMVATVSALRVRSHTETTRLAVLGSIVIAILLAASLVDYPLRTPLLASWFAIACGWLSMRRIEPVEA
jgi:O-antigen ligase